MSITTLSVRSSVCPSVSFHLLLCLSLHVWGFIASGLSSSVYAHVIAVLRATSVPSTGLGGRRVEVLPLEGMLHSRPIAVQTEAHFLSSTAPALWKFPSGVKCRNERERERKINKSPFAMFSFKRLGASERGSVKQQLQINKSSRGAELSPWGDGGVTLI